MSDPYKQLMQSWLEISTRSAPSDAQWNEGYNRANIQCAEELEVVHNKWASSLMELVSDFREDSKQLRSRKNSEFSRRETHAMADAKLEAAIRLELLIKGGGQ